ncbi:MAG: hypothetical protein WD081_04135 [Gammaproteobacteria bacterium]
MHISGTIVVVAVLLFSLLYAIETGVWNWLTITTVIVLGVIGFVALLTYLFAMQEAARQQREAKRREDEK